MRRAIHLILMASLLGSMGAHLAIIQAVAWGKMTVDFSQKESLTASLQNTFDGQHPCQICLRVKKASPSGPSLGISSSDNRLDGFFLSSVPQINRIPVTWRLTAESATLNNHIVLPASPPPKDILS